MTERQMILGQYIAQLFKEGAISKKAAVPEMIRKVSREITGDLQVILSVVAREKAASLVNGIAEYIRRYDMRPRDGNSAQQKTP